MLLRSARHGKDARCVVPSLVHHSLLGVFVDNIWHNRGTTAKVNFTIPRNEAVCPGIKFDAESIPHSSEKACAKLENGFVRVNGSAELEILDAGFLREVIHVFIGNCLKIRDLGGRDTVGEERKRPSLVRILRCCPFPRPKLLGQNGCAANVHHSFEWHNLRV